MRPKRSPDRDGFALIEAIVAFLILATALTIGVQAVARGTTAIRRADEISMASLVMRELVATTLPRLPDAGVWTGRHASGAAWRIAARVAVDYEAAPPLLEVAIDVRPPGARAPYPFRTAVIGAASE